MKVMADDQCRSQTLLVHQSACVSRGGQRVHTLWVDQDACLGQTSIEQIAPHRTRFVDPFHAGRTTDQHEPHASVAKEFRRRVEPIRQRQRQRAVGRHPRSKHDGDVGVATVIGRAERQHMQSNHHNLSDHDAAHRQQRRQPTPRLSRRRRTTQQPDVSEDHDQHTQTERHRKRRRDLALDDQPEKQRHIEHRSQRDRQQSNPHRSCPSGWSFSNQDASGRNPQQDRQCRIPSHRGPLAATQRIADPNTRLGRTLPTQSGQRGHARRQCHDQTRPGQQRATSDRDQTP